MHHGGTALAGGLYALMLLSALERNTNKSHDSKRIA